MQWLKENLSMNSSNAGRETLLSDTLQLWNPKHHNLIWIIWYFTAKKLFSDVLIKQADTKAKELKAIMLPVNFFDTEV